MQIQKCCDQKYSIFGLKLPKSDAIVLSVPLDKARNPHFDWCAWLIPNSFMQSTDISSGILKITRFHRALDSNSIDTKKLRQNVYPKFKLKEYINNFFTSTKK